MIKELSLFNKLGLMPYISSVFIEKHTLSKVTANLQINVPFKRGSNPWILDDKVLRFLNVVVTISTNSKLTELLDSTKREWAFSGISEAAFVNGKDFYQVVKKIQPSYLHFTVEENVKTSTKVIHTGFIEDAVFEKSTLDHLAIFVAVGIDLKEAALRFKSIPTLFKETMGYCYKETFITNSVLVNKKASDISLLQSISKFNFNTLKIPQFSDLLNTKIYDHRINSRSNRIFSSELFVSIDKINHITGFFVTDILELFKSESNLSLFFDRNDFLTKFFSDQRKFLPKKVKLFRYDEQLIETLLYDGIYSPLIETDNVIITKVQFTEGKKLYTSFKDKTSKELTRLYKYRVVFEFEDTSIQYLDDILRIIEGTILSVNKVLNIAESGRTFDYVSNYFNDRFYLMLERDNLSIKDIINSVYNILSQFIVLTNEERNNIINLSNSRYCNFEVLDQLYNILAFLRTQVSTLKTTVSNTETIHIVVDNFFDLIIDRTNNISLKEEVIRASDEVGYPSISRDAFFKRITIEVNKFFGVSDVIYDSKFSYFSPLSIENGELSISQEVIDLTNIQKYNRFLIDMYFNIYQRTTSSKLHILEKLVSNLLYNEADLNEFNLKVENVETVIFTEIAPTTSPTVLRTGGFRVGDTVGSLLYIW